MVHAGAVFGVSAVHGGKVPKSAGEQPASSNLGLCDGGGVVHARRGFGGMVKQVCGEARCETPWLRLSSADIAKAINDTFAQFPKRFDFNGFNPFGDDPQQSPIWIRPWALEIANIARLSAGLVQVFGHTVPKDPQAVFQKSMESQGHKYFHADLLSHRMYLVLKGDSFSLQNLPTDYFNLA